MKWRGGRLTLITIYFFTLHIIAFLIFSKGFFLTRYEVPQKSHCRESPAEIKGREFLKEGDCWSPTKFDKLVVIIIDALRYDYAVYDENITSPRYNANKLPTINHLLKNQPEHSHLFRFLADPPTVTMQRLKGLTTGSLPTFIDISSNFDSSSIQEDNLIHQFLSNGKRVTFMGDDTWESLFPNMMNKSWPYPSFNVKDLHTVDDGVLLHLIPEIRSQDFDVLIAHFLGVDHVGHRYESNHPAMADKLTQMDKMIGEVVASITPDTLLLIMGDHGSTDEGDHGGASEKELNAALFVYSKSLGMSPSSRIESQQYRAISQIDLVPTISLALGIPIPYGNLGTIIPELFLGTNDPQNSDREKLMDTNHNLHVNTHQTLQYLKSYSEISSEFPEKLIHDLTTRLSEADNLFRRTKSFHPVSDHVTIFQQYVNFQLEIVDICRQMWVSFDLISMVTGVVMLIVICFALLLQIILPEPFPAVFMGAGSIIGAISASLPMGFEPPSIHRITLPLIGYAIGSLTVLIAFKLKFILKTSIMSHVRRDMTWDIVTCSMFLSIHGISLFSNSFIENENHVIRFLISTFLAFLGIFAVRSKNAEIVGKIFILNVLFKLNVYTTGGIYEDANTSAIIFFLETILPLPILPFFFWKFFRIFGEDFFSLKAFQGILLLLVGIYWSLQKMDSLGDWVAQIVPKSIYLGTFLGIFRITRSFGSGAILLPCLTLLSLLYIPLMLLQGVKGAVGMSVFIVTLYYFAEVCRQLRCELRPNFFPMSVVLAQAFFTVHYFFGSGHRYEFSSIHWAAGFVGFNEMNFFGSGALVILETFAAPIIVVIALPCIILWVSKREPNENTSIIPIDGDDYDRYGRSFLMYMFFFGFNATMTTLSAFTHRRHLMVWRVFAPKYIFDGIFAMVVDLLVVLISYFISSMH